MSSEDIKNRKLTEVERQALLRVAESQRAGNDSGIDFSDIPKLTEEQLSQMVSLRELQRKVRLNGFSGTDA